MNSPVLNQIVIGLSVVLVVWLLAGRVLNRRRANHLAVVIRQALPALGARATLQPIGQGAGGFRIDVAEPAAGLAAVSLLCLLEARDFPFVWAWTRLRGRRDQVILRLDATGQPLRPGRVDAMSARAGELGLQRLLLAATQPVSPHVQVSFGVGPGEEAQVGIAFALAARLARGEQELPG